jgi:hypothetical protein
MLPQIRDPPVSASLELGLQVCITMPNCVWFSALLGHRLGGEGPRVVLSYIVAIRHVDYLDITINYTVPCGYLNTLFKFK